MFSTSTRMSRTTAKPKQRLEAPSRRSNSVSPEVKLHSRPLMAMPMSNKDPGAVSEDQFLEAFKDYPMVTVASGGDLYKELMNIHTALDNASDEWEKRVDALKLLRGLVVANAVSFPEFQMAMRYVDISLQNVVRDLRSQLAREAAITVAFMAKQLGIKSERTMEMTLPSLLTIIPSSIKVISSSGIVAIRIILANVLSPKLVPIITQEYMSSKSKETRRACCDFIGLCLDTFPKSAVERHLAGLREAIKRGLSDADSDTRVTARRAYASFCLVFPMQARELYQDLDSQKQKLLDETVRWKSSQSDLRSEGSKELKFPKSTTLDNIHGHAFKTPSRPADAVLRSVSAVDSAAARRAKTNLLPQYRGTPSAGTVSANSIRSAMPQLQRSMRRYPVRAPQTALKLPVKFLEKRTENTPDRVGAESANLDKGVHFTTNLSDIVISLGSANWNTKRDGVVNLQRYMLLGKSLTLAEMESVMGAFTRLLNESSNRLLGIYLETLYDFVRIYALQLGSWLYTLLVKIWNKQNSDNSDSIDQRIQKVLSLLRQSFPVEIQIQHVMRCMTDHSLPKNKPAILNYFITLIQTSKSHPEDFRNASLTRLGISRLVSWVYDPNNPEEVRQNSQLALVLLNEINCKEFVAVLETLDQDLHNKAVRLIACYPKRPSVVINDHSGKRSPAVMSIAPHLKITNGTPPRKLPSDNPQGSNVGNDENRKPDKSSGNLQRRSIEVQPGIGNGIRNFPSSEQAIADMTVLHFAKLSPEEQKNFLLHWSDKFQVASKSNQHQMLNQLESILQEMAEPFWADNFMVVMPMLYNVAHGAGTDGQIAAKILNCLTLLLRLQPERVLKFPELTIVNIFEIQRFPSTSVTQAADECIRLAARTFPCEVVVKILIPIIVNEHEPENVLAVRFFSFMCQERTSEQLLPVIPSIVPPLVMAYSHSEQSTMRKECCYALIYAQLSVGEEVITPYCRKLPASKIRLMNVYMKRIAQDGYNQDSDSRTDL